MYFKNALFVILHLLQALILIYVGYKSLLTDLINSGDTIPLTHKLYRWQSTHAEQRVGINKTVMYVDTYTISKMLKMK
jgi:hypothetical protein